jgi:DNA-binding NarL/FixJ family response regulator
MRWLRCSQQQRPLVLRLMKTVTEAPTCEAASGTSYLSSNVAAQVAPGIVPQGDRPLHELLSNREFEILRMIGAGKPATEIVYALKLSVKTVSTYGERILDKMNLSSNFEMIRYVLQEGLLE